MDRPLLPAGDVGGGTGVRIAAVIGATAAVAGAVLLLIASRRRDARVARTRIVYDDRQEPVRRVTRYPGARRVNLKEPRVMQEVRVRLPDDEIRRTLKSIARDLR